MYNNHFLIDLLFLSIIFQLQIAMFINLPFPLMSQGHYLSCPCSQFVYLLMVKITGEHSYQDKCLGFITKCYLTFSRMDYMFMAFYHLLFKVLMHLFTMELFVLFMIQIVQFIMSLVTILMFVSLFSLLLELICFSSQFLSFLTLQLILLVLLIFPYLTSSLKLSYLSLLIHIFSETHLFTLLLILIDYLFQ